MTITDKLSSIEVTKDDSNKIKDLYDKLNDNIILFEKLESEITGKDILINKQTDTITHQKATIDKLLDHIAKLMNIEDKRIYNSSEPNTDRNSDTKAYSDNIDRLIELRNKINKKEDESISFITKKAKNDDANNRDYTGMFELSNTDRLFQVSSSTTKTNFVDHEIQDILNQ
jgi:uncharacterized coiled-coil protein SlyX